jgi:hypothetical protein
MLNSLLPHNLITRRNPVFDYELRSIGRSRTREDLKRLVVNMLALFHAVALGGWCIVGSLISARPTYTYGASTVANIHSTNLLIAGIAAFISIGITLGADVYYFLTTVTSISDPITAGQWDLLRLTRVPENDILAAKYAARLVRAWRTLAIEVAWRVISVTFISFSVVTSLLDSGRYSFSYSVDTSMSLVVWLGCFAIVAAVYIVEPFWRMRTFVAMGLWISAAVRNSTFAALAGLGSIMGVRLAQVALLVAINLCVVNMLRGGGYNSWGGYSATGGALWAMTVICIVGGTIYALYRALRTTALRRLAQQAFRSE